MNMNSKKNDYVELVGGERFYWDNPVFPIRSMAISLSRIPRFTGHFKEEVEHYSVLQHCLLVSHLSPYPLEGLLHDWPEAIVNDISSPIKRLLPNYRDFEDSIYRPLAHRYGLPLSISPETGKADMEALIIEANAIMHGGGRDYVCYDEYKYALDKQIAILPLYPREAFEAFCIRWKQLTGEDIEPMALPLPRVHIIRAATPLPEESQLSYACHSGIECSDS